MRTRHQENFESWFFSKVKPISGDLLKDSLALSKEDEEFVTQNVEIIINSAASVDFNARIDEAINTNTLGTLRVYSLAKKCIKLHNFLHVSTAYVNANKNGKYFKIYNYSKLNLHTFKIIFNPFCSIYFKKEIIVN